MRRLVVANLGSDFDFDSVTVRSAPSAVSPAVPIPGSVWKYYKGGKRVITLVGYFKGPSELSVCYYRRKEALVNGYRRLYVSSLSKWQQEVSPGVRRHAPVCRYKAYGSDSSVVEPERPRPPSRA